MILKIISQIAGVGLRNQGKIGRQGDAFQRLLFPVLI
jgi:hypothetical protein